MPRGKQYDQKLKPYLVFQYLMKHSDEEHVVTASEIVAYLQEIGISAERRSIYRDIEEINKALYIAEYECPLEEALEALEDEEEKIVVYDSAKRGYYVRQRHYELSDISLLAECIYATKFIDEKNAKKLINVIGDLVSEPQAEKLKHDVYLTDRVKTDNSKVYYYVNTINEAMSGNIVDGKRHIPEKIRFKYLKYTIQDVKHKVERRGGEDYIVSPFKLLINDGNYYLIAFADKGKKIKTYRVDRMKDVALTGEAREGEEEFKRIDLESYTKSHFSMFGGDKEFVTIQFTNDLLDTVIERFGIRGIQYSKVDEKRFAVSVEVEISMQFFSWLCGFGAKARITKPSKVKREFSDFLSSIMRLY